MQKSYKCGICDTEYQDVYSRMKCETQCIKKQQEEEKAAAQAKLKAEKDVRYKEVVKAVESAVKLIESFNTDYQESFVYTKSNDSISRQKAHQAFSRACFWL